jgi:hypothetical protein
VFFLSDAFSKGYDFRGASSGRPGNEVELRQVWGQLLVTVQHRDVAKLIVSLPLVGDDPAEPSMAWCCVVCGIELAMIVATKSDKNDEELAINGVVGSENDAVSPACTVCAKCETYYKKCTGCPKQILRRHARHAVLNVQSVLSSVIFPIVKIVALFASDVFQRELSKRVRPSYANTKSK